VAAPRGVLDETAIGYEDEVVFCELTPPRFPRGSIRRDALPCAGGPLALIAPRVSISGGAGGRGRRTSNLRLCVGRRLSALCQDPDDSVEAFVRHPEQARVGVAQFEDQEHRARDADRPERGQDDCQRVDIR
jgi:hypothetical protein